MSQTEQVILYGCGGHSRSVADILLDTSPAVSIVFVDENAQEGERIFGFPVVPTYELGTHKYFFAIGDNNKRKDIFVRLGSDHLISIPSSRAYISRCASIGTGCFVGNFCHIGPEACIGVNTIINTAAIIEHEVTIGSHSHIGPNAVVAGRSKIEDLVFVGTGASIGNYLSICSNVIIGAGATVVRDITEPGTYVGTPARRIK